MNIQSGNDTNIIGGIINGEKVTADIGGNLNIKTKQNKNSYDEKNHSSGINISFDGAITGSINQGNTNSKYESATNQSGIYADKEGFDIYVQNNTDLKGGIISSETDKNKHSTSTLTFEDIHNSAEYSSSNKGININTGKNADKKDAGITPNIGMPAEDEANSDTKATIAKGEIEIRDKEHQKQNLDELNRNTENSLNKLGEIFDKETIKERQELAQLFGEMAYGEIHKISEKNGWQEGSIEKNALHALVGGIMSELSNEKFLAGASSATINEMVQKELSEAFKDDPSMHQWASTLIGSTVSQIIEGNAQFGASSASSATRNNNLAESAARVAIKLNLMPNPNDMISDYCYVQISGGVGQFLSGDLGCIIDKYGNLYGFIQGDAGIGISPPISTDSGIGTIETNWKKENGDNDDAFISAITGGSYGAGGTSLVSASVSKGVNGGPLTVEVGFSTSAGITVYCYRYAILLGNIYND